MTFITAVPPPRSRNTSESLTPTLRNWSNTSSYLPHFSVCWSLYLWSISHFCDLPQTQNTSSCLIIPIMLTRREGPVLLNSVIFSYQQVQNNCPAWSFPYAPHLFRASQNWLVWLKKIKASCHIYISYYFILYWDFSNPKSIQIRACPILWNWFSILN